MGVPDFSTMSDQELLALISTCGLDVPVGLPEAIVARGPAMVEPLCGIVAEPGYWECGDVFSGWAPVHAMHLLGAIGDPRAVDALLAPLSWGGVPDAYLDSGGGVLAHLGPDAIPALTKLAREAQDEYAAYVALQGVLGIGLMHPEHAEVAPNLARELVTKTLQAGGLVPAVLAESLAHIGNAADLELLRQAYEEDRWSDYFHIRWEELEQDLRDGNDCGETERATRDPMEHFSVANLRMWRRNHEPRGKRAVAAPPHDYPVIGSDQHETELQAKPSRNGPCPCGSGRKYKRCCGK